MICHDNQGWEVNRSEGWNREEVPRNEVIEGRRLWNRPLNRAELRSLNALSNSSVARLRQMAVKLAIWTAVALFTVIPSTAGLAQSQAGADGVSVQTGDLSRVIAIGSAVTETIFALGEENHLIAVDESSSYPAEGVAKLGKVSVSRNLNAEGVLSYNPSLIIATASSGPESAIRQIRSTGVPVLMVTAGETPEDAKARIREIGKALEEEEQSERLIRKMEEELAAAGKIREALQHSPSVMFIYARGQNNLMVAGARTSANTMIELAGGKNVFSEFDGYKPLTAESVVQANPEVILMMDSGLDSVGGKQGVLSSPGVRYTRAADAGRIHAMDGVYLLGFGPRLGSAVIDVMKILHLDLDIAELK